jgi:hypothetical protein
MTCKANVGTRKAPRPCGKATAKGMLAACEQHKTMMIPTGETGIYWRGSRYVAVTVHRGQQTKTAHRTLSDAREERKKDTRVRAASPARTPFDQYARPWIKNFQGRTGAGFDEGTRASYERALERYWIPHFRSTRAMSPRVHFTVTLLRTLDTTALTRQFGRDRCQRSDRGS